MAAPFIGVLGESTTASTGTNTVYTVPAGRASKVKCMFTFKGGSGGTSTFAIKVNNAQVMITGALASTDQGYSSTAALLKVGASIADGLAAATTVAPGPPEYYLAAADVISYVVATEDLASVNFQVVGTETSIT